MELRVSSQQAAASLDHLLDRVSNGGDEVVIERGGVPVGKLVAAGAGASPADAPAPFTPGAPATVDDLVEVLRAWPALDDGWADAVEDAIRRDDRRT